MTTATTTVKVADYRRAIGCVNYAFTSLQGCRGPRERAIEAEMVRDTARKLMALECKRATQEDRDDAERIIDITASYLIKHGL